MTFIIAIIIFFLGLIIFSFSVSNIILILFFGIPFTKKLEKLKFLKKNNIIGSYIISLFIQLIIIFVPTIIFYIYFSDSYFISLMIGYVFGLFSMVSKIKEFGLNMNNFLDYFEKNKKYFWEEVIDKYNESKEDLLKFIILAYAEINK